MHILYLRQSSTDPHRGFGYVEFSLPEDAREAIDNMDASEIFGRVIKVNQAKPQKDHNEGLGSKTAVWEQVHHATLSRPFSNLLFSANEPHRRATLPNTMLWRPTPLVLTTSGKIQCKVLKVSPKRVHARNEKPSFNRTVQRVCNTAWRSSTVNCGRNRFICVLSEGAGVCYIHKNG